MKPVLQELTIGQGTYDIYSDNCNTELRGWSGHLELVGSMEVTSEQSEIHSIWQVGKGKSIPSRGYSMSKILEVRKICGGKEARRPLRPGV